MAKLPDDWPGYDFPFEPFEKNLEWSRSPDYLRVSEMLKPVEAEVMAELVTEAEAAVAAGGDPAVLLDPGELRLKQSRRILDMMREWDHARGKIWRVIKVEPYAPQPAKPRRKRSAQR